MTDRASPAHDAELLRVSATYRVTREGVNADGSLWADLDGLPLHGTRRLPESDDELSAWEPAPIRREPGMQGPMLP